MRVNVLTPSYAGPYIWGRDLVSALRQKGLFARHYYRLRGLALATIFHRSDIVHAGAVLLPFRLWKKPTVLTLHGDYVYEKYQGIHQIPIKFYHTAIKLADRITTPSLYLKEKLGLDNAIVVPNGVVIEAFKPRLHEDRETINVTTITGFDFPQKAVGPLKTLDFLRKASLSTDKKINYWVVGKGRYLDAVKKCAYGSPITTIFTGYVSQPSSVLRCSDIFLYYSRRDIFPIVLLEAMASGLPVITNEFGAAHEIITQHYDGYVAYDNEMYLDYLLKLIECPHLRQRIGQSARKTVESKFDQSKVSDRFIKIYLSLGACYDV